MNKYLSHILIAGFFILFVQGFFKGPEGYSEAEVLQKIQLDRYKQDKIKDIKIMQEQEFKITTYENFYDSLEADNSIDTVKSKQLKFNLSNYASSRR